MAEPGALEQWCSGWLSREERLRAARLRQPSSRNQFVVGRGMCRSLIGRRAAVCPSEVQFRITAHGKPHVAAPRDAVVQFNVAHTDRLAICALGGELPIGVDVERLDRPVNLALADRYFAPSEARWVASRSARRRQEAFLRIWTLKEAFIKAIGRGLAIPLDAFAFEDADTPRPRLRMLDPSLGEAASWSFASLVVRGDCAAAVALPTREGIEAVPADFSPLATDQASAPDRQRTHTP